MKKYDADFERILRRHVKKGKDLCSIFGLLTLIRIVIEILKKEKGGY